MSDKRFSPARNKFWVHSGHTIGARGFSFNRPRCKLCRVFDGRECEYKYCVYCFAQLLGISGIYGANRRRRVGGIVRRSRELYKTLTSPDNGLELR